MRWVLAPDASQSSLPGLTRQSMTRLNNKARSVLLAALHHGCPGQPRAWHRVCCRACQYRAGASPKRRL